MKKLNILTTITEQLSTIKYPELIVGKKAYILNPSGSSRSEGISLEIISYLELGVTNRYN